MNNKESLYNMLAGQSNAGQGAANTGIQVGQSSAGNIGSILGQQANATQSANNNRGNMFNQGIAGLLGGGSSQYGRQYYNNAGQNDLPWQTQGNVNPLGGFYRG